MDAKNDTDTVDKPKFLRPIRNQKPRKAKIAIKMSSERETISDQSVDCVSESPRPDVQGQMYLWDISEEPNVYMRQSHLEEFLYAVLTDYRGVPSEIFTNIVAYMMQHCSVRFKRGVFFYMVKDGDRYRFDPPKDGPAYQEIYS